VDARDYRLAGFEAASRASPGLLERSEHDAEADVCDPVACAASCGPTSQQRSAQMHTRGPAQESNVIP
jgi:hypothetical protein